MIDNVFPLLQDVGVLGNSSRCSSYAGLQSLLDNVLPQKKKRVVPPA